MECNVPDVKDMKDLTNLVRVSNKLAQIEFKKKPSAEKYLKAVLVLKSKEDTEMTMRYIVTYNYVK